MTFLNAALALGAVAAVVPLLIHLLYRSRYRTVAWGAMHLVNDIVLENQRRMRWMNLLLLLVRLAIPVLLALCLARPLLTGVSAGSGEVARSIVLVIDDSRSMAVRGGDGMTRIDRTKASLRSWVSTLSRRDEVLWLTTSGIKQPVAAIGREELRQRIAELSVAGGSAGGPVTLDRMVDAALDALSRATHAQRQIVIVSDFQNIVIPPSSDGQWKRLNQRMARAALPPQISLLRIADSDGDDPPPANVSVDVVAIDTPAVIVGQTTPLYAEVRNASDRPAAGVTVSWTVDDENIGTRAVTLPPKATTYLRIGHAVEAVGAHTIAVGVDVKDALAPDNRRQFKINAIDAIEVLIIDGRPSMGSLPDASSFLRLALQPFGHNAAGGGPRPANTFQVEVTTPTEFAATTNPPRQRIVVMCGVSLANMRDVDRAALVSRLVQSLHRGGTVVIFGGGEAPEDQIHWQTWKSDTIQLTLPAAIGPRTAIDDGVGIDSGHDSFAPWAMLSSSGGSPLGDVRVLAYHRLELQDVDAAAGQPPPVVPLRLTGGDPLVVIAPANLSTGSTSKDASSTGRIVQFAISCDPLDSNLPLRPAFVPLMQQLFLYLAGQNGADTADDDVPATESDLRGSPPERLSAIARSIGSDVFASADDLIQQDHANRFGREVWRWFWLALLGMMVGELLVLRNLRGRLT